MAEATLLQKIFVTICAVTRSTDLAARWIGAAPFLPALFVLRYANMGGLDHELFAEQIRPFVKRTFVTLGTDGFGRSDTREKLRHFFEVDRHWVTLAALKALADEGKIEREKVAAALVKYQLDPSKPNPMSV